MKKRTAKTQSPSPASRRAVEPPKFEGFDDMMEWRRQQGEKPIARAWDKVYSFVNGCVTDPDFRHPQSEALLRFLLLTRDLLTDGINENWTLDDIIEPIEEAVRKHAANNRMAGLQNRNAAKDAALKWAQEFACSKWSTGCRYKVKKMAIEAWEAMAGTPHEQARPRDALSLVAWVKPVAPPWARKPGRPPSNG